MDFHVSNTPSGGSACPAKPGLHSNGTTTFWRVSRCVIIMNRPVWHVLAAGFLKTLDVFFEVAAGFLRLDVFFEFAAGFLIVLRT
jgi:predicted anti-sigma-YlaC factor YlaD